MVVENFFPKVLKVKVKGQFNKNGRCMYIMTISVIMTMHCCYNLIFQIFLP